ncbi:MAG: trehalase family glycosidase [Victivallaceae bacterium]|nr:trehalase family glycosidase [Victivallaceae bacterium]
MDFNFEKNRIPEIVIDRCPEFIGLYDVAWQLAARHITESPNMPVHRYMDEAFEPSRVWIWDSCFMTFYCRYAADFFPGIETLDNFYSLLYDRSAGECFVHHADNPPLFAWAEYEYFKFTGDRKRLERILLQKQYLQRHYDFIENIHFGQRFPSVFCLNTLQKNECGYLWSGVASGMDNTPRGNGIQNNLYWVDIVAQQALSAMYISKLAKIMGDGATSRLFHAYYEEKKELLNSRFFDQHDGCYYDIHAATHDACRKLTPASFWALLAEVADPDMARRQVAVLRDPALLGGDPPIPSISRSDCDFEPDGRYWRGGVWLPTSYMTIKSLEKYGEFELAAKLAEQTVAAMARVYRKFEPHTIWEVYSPTADRPAAGKRPDRSVRPDFCGWSALGPISLVIENVIGIYDIDAMNHTMRIYRRRQGRHGVRNLRFGDVCCSVMLYDDRIEVETDRAFTLLTQNGEYTCNPGCNIFENEPQLQHKEVCI